VLALMVNLEPMLAESTAAHLSPQRTVASSRALAADLLHWENNLSLQTPGGTHHTVQYLTKRTPEGELLSSTVRAARKTSDRKLKFNAKQELRVNVAAHSRDWSELSEEERHAAHMFGFEYGTICGLSGRAQVLFHFIRRFPPGSFPGMLYQLSTCMVQLPLGTTGALGITSYCRASIKPRDIVCMQLVRMKVDVGDAAKAWNVSDLKLGSLPSKLL
jgi:hypothetical protein